MQNIRYSCRILMKLEFSQQIFEKSQISSFIKIRPVTDEMFHADRRKEMTKLMFAFQNLANAPYKQAYMKVMPKSMYKVITLV
jgi:hypothetical protein